MGLDLNSTKRDDVRRLIWNKRLFVLGILQEIEDVRDVMIEKNWSTVGLKPDGWPPKKL